jgi:metal-responsive CopG/Arc/MetJ family transcriptional regulator
MSQVVITLTGEQLQKLDAACEESKMHRGEFATQALMAVLDPKKPKTKSTKKGRD